MLKEVSCDWLAVQRSGGRSGGASIVLGGVCDVIDHYRCDNGLAEWSERHRQSGYVIDAESAVGVALSFDEWLHD